MKTRMSRNHVNGSLPCLLQATTRPSIEIGFFTETDKKLIEHSIESKTDFTTPEKGLSRYISKDLLKIFSSEDMMLKLPDNYFHHHFIYNCKTCSFSSYNDSRRARTLEKNDNEELRDISTYGFPMLSSSKRNLSKSQTEIIFKIPKRTREESLLDIKLVGTSLALNPSMMCDECECICSTAETKVEKKLCNIPLGLKKIESLQKYVQNYEVVASSEDVIPDSCFCPEQTESCPTTDTNKVSIKLGENLFLSLVTDMDDQTESIACDECNAMPESSLNDKYPDIKILVKCNGETIREISAPLGSKYEGAISKKSPIQDDSEICSLFSCDNRLGKDDQKPLDFRPTCCMAIDTTAINYVCTDTLKPKCSLSMQKEESDKSCTKCPLVTRVCGVPHRLCQDTPLPAFPQKKGTPPPKKISQPTGKKPSKPTPKKGVRAESKDANRSSASLKKTSSIGPVDKRKSSLCSCPPNKDDIASLGSFSLFFIINDMKTGDCACKKASNSNELLQTAMICIHVDNSQDKGKCNQKKTSSCPALDASDYRQRGNFAPAVCSCPSSAASKASSCSCPSVKASTCPASYSQSTAKPTGYVCPFTKEAQKPKAPISQCVDTGMRSSMQKSPCSQHSQIRFSETIQAGKGKSCSAMACPEQLSATTQCQPSTSPKFAVQQTSVQVCPSKRSACIQPSRTCPPPQPLQTCVSQKSANTQPSTCNSVSGASQARQVLSNICPPSCKINLPKPCPFEKPPCTPTMRLGPAQPVTCNMKTGPSFVCTAVKSVSCPSLKQNVCSGPDFKPPSCTPSVVRVNESTATQSKSCSICINVSGPNDSRASLKKVCSFSGECKQDVKVATSKESIRRRLGAAKSLSSSSMMRGKLTPSSSKGCFSDRSGTSCSICRELSKLGECENDVKPKKSASKVKPRVIPAQKLKRGNNFSQLSHLDVSGADNFIFGESRKGDLQLITEDYSDLKKAFEKFMVSGNPQNPKCKYVKKG